MTITLAKMLRATAEADKLRALKSLDLLSRDAVGIGDHSTKDFWNNAEEALELLASSEDRIEMLEKYFSKDL